MKKTIVIGGGTGLVGSRIIELLPEDKYDIRVLSRSDHDDTSQIKYFHWDVVKMDIEDGVMDDVDYVLNLTGAGIADKRWTDDRKRILINSRVDSTKLLGQAIEKSKSKPKAFISSSAVGFYGDRADEILTEKSQHGDGFLAECCLLWEDAVTDLLDLVDREVRMRTGIVLSTKGGALPKVLMTKAIGLYNYFGDGQQYYSWVHIDDLARMFIQAIEDDSMKGIYNAVAPEPLTNKAFTTQVKEALSSSGLVLPAPSFGLRLVLGEMGDVVLSSTRVVPTKLNDVNFDYKYTDLGKAVKDVVENGK